MYVKFTSNRVEFSKLHVGNAFIRENDEAFGVYIKTEPVNVRFEDIEEYPINAVMLMDGNLYSVDDDEEVYKVDAELNVKLSRI